MNGTFPGQHHSIKNAGNKTDILIQLEYSVEKIITHLDETIAARKPYAFSFKKFFQPID